MSAAIPVEHPPLLVFLSHTSDLADFPAERSFVDAAVAAVVGAENAVIDMAYFGARDAKPADYSAAMVARADVYVGIIGFRYGTPVPDRPELSHTELEFETATERGLTRLIYLVRADAPYLPAYFSRGLLTVRTSARSDA